MNARQLIGTVASLVAVAALALAWQEFNAARGAVQARAAIAKNHAALDLAEQAARRAAAVTAATPAAPPGPSSGGAVRPRGGRPPSVPGLLAADPKLMALYLKSFRAGLSDRYGATYARLGLTPAQIDRFEEMTTAHEADIMDLQGAAEAQGLTGNDPGITAMRRQSNKQYQKDLLAFATDAGVSLAQITEEQRLATPQMQGVMTTLASTTILTGAPMTYAQAGQLAPIVAAANPGNGDVKAEAIDWDKVAAQAAGVLSPQQIEALQLQATVGRITGLVKQFHDQAQPAPAP